MDKQKILSSKNVFSTDLFDVREMDIEFGNGKKATHHVIERRPAVYIFPITKKYELYLAREYSYVMNENVLQIAGFVEKNENPLQAARRELQEETGITAQYWELFAQLQLAKSSLNAPVYLYVAKELEVGISKPEETEDIKVIKISLKEAVAKVLNGEINKAAVVAGILLLDKLKSEKRL